MFSRSDLVDIGVARENGGELEAGPSEGLPPWTIATAAQRILAVDFAIEELIHLRRQATAALRIHRVVRHVKSGVIIPTWAYGRLSDADMESADRATVEFAARLRPSEGDARLPLIIPQSFRTMAGRRGRAALAIAARGSSGALKARVIVELMEVNRGTPSARLAEVTGLLRTTCKGAFVRLQPGRNAAASVREARLQGLSLDAGDITGTDSEVAGALLGVGEQVQGCAPMLVAQGLSSDGFFAVAEVAGFTHASLRGEAVD